MENPPPTRDSKEERSRDGRPTRALHSKARGCCLLGGGGGGGVPQHTSGPRRGNTVGQAPVGPDPLLITVLFALPPSNLAPLGSRQMVTITATLATCAIALFAANADATGGWKPTGNSCSHSFECAGYCDNGRHCYSCSTCLSDRDAIEGYCPSGCSGSSGSASSSSVIVERSNIYTATVTECTHWTGSAVPLL